MVQLRPWPSMITSYTQAADFTWRVKTLQNMLPHGMVYHGQLSVPGCQGTFILSVCMTENFLQVLSIAMRGTAYHGQNMKLVWTDM